MRDRLADLAGSRPAMEVFVHVACFKRRHFTFHSYLPAQTFPMEARSCPGIACQFQALSALGVGKEAKGAPTYLLRQYHAHAWHAVWS